MLDDEDEAPCARCRRPTPVETMRLWTTRERVRTLARAVGAPPAFDLRPEPPRASQPMPEPRSGLSPGPPSGRHADGALAVRAPPAFRASTVTRADAVCPACYDRLGRGAALDGPERRRVWLTMAAFLLIALALVWGVPALLPNLIAAFWRNGAGGR